MICQVCGLKPAVVHMEELWEGKRAHLWLCEECAGNRQDWDSTGEQENEESPDVEDRRVFSNFLGQMFQTGETLDDEPAACPTCGFQLNLLGKTNRLGCPSCYSAFRSSLKPILGRLHRHSSHLGKGPWQSEGERTPEGEIARYRVALEKAIVSENYEEAARLRDLISRVEVSDQASNEGKNGEEE